MVDRYGAHFIELKYFRRNARDKLCFQLNTFVFYIFDNAMT